MNDDDPVGAKCLEEAVVPEGHRGPLLDRCQPSRCANSILGPEHLPIWTAERGSLNRLRADPQERLLSGQPQQTDGKLTKNNLCREAGISRATMNRAPELLTEWDARTATSPAGLPSPAAPHRRTRRASRQAAQEPRGVSRPSGTGRRGGHRHHDPPRGERIAS